MKLVNSILLVLFLTFITTFAQESNQFDKDAEIAAVTKAIHGSIGWAKDKDLNILYNIIADDPNFLEVHPDESVVFGFEQFKKAERFWMDPRFKAIRYEIRDLKINLSQSGDVAWFYCVLDDINEWEGQPSNWENTRWTGILEKRDGKWRTVQQHFSFAVGE